jgi:heterodisulfide reductase subunit C/nitrate reductase gamma subunit
MNAHAIIAYTALGIGLGGIFWRIGRWFRLVIGAEDQTAPIGQAVLQTCRAVVRTLFSPRILRVVRSLIWEVLLQGHVMKQDWRRGVMHLGLFYGFLFLVVFHALDDFTSARLWPDYAATLNPWRFLRNLGGALILAGAIMAARRRRSDPILRRTRTAGDRLVLVLLTVMILSGVLLESSQIVSPSIFNTMVEDYMFDDDPEEVEALRSYWQSAFGAAAVPAHVSSEPAPLAVGRNMHAAFCADCHDRPQSAFLSYPLSWGLKPLANALDRARFATIIGYLHFVIACLGLALLPFTKFFHLVATPTSLLVRSTGDTASSPARLRPLRRVMGLDACTHCGVCSQHCAVAIIYRAIPNPTILPSEKLGALKRGVSGTSPSHAVTLAEGSFICTACGRCTHWCPSGIDLQDLWRASQGDLVRNGFPPVSVWIRTRTANQWAAHVPPPEAPPVDRRPGTLGISESPETFWACVQCTTCTSVCPVVMVSEDPRRDLDLTPQQVMNLMRLQLRELALGARMVWDCVTCYQCQEHCPQGVKVADVLYELRNEAAQRLTPEYPVRVPDDFIPRA